MGLLTAGAVQPLTYEEIQVWKDHIKKHGLIQFVNWYNKVKHINHDTLKWGDEIEMFMLKFDHEQKSAKLLLKAKDLLETLQIEEQANPGKTQTAWRPEMTEYMIESSPGRPYGGSIQHFNTVEANMVLRRKELMALLRSREPGDVGVITCSTYPRLGCERFLEPHVENNVKENDISRSLYVPDVALNQLHPRFQNLARMITARKQRKVYGEVPIFRDVNTPNPFMESVPDWAEEDKAVLKPNHVHMDTVTMGLGCGCLQVTFQACNVPEARVLYDQNAVLAPIMLALSASSPAVRGYLVDTDCRFENISMLCDDRTEEELGFKPLENYEFQIPTSRYGAVDMYLSPEGNAYNDCTILYRQEHLDILLEGGIDRQLAEHVAHLFIRDPLAVYHGQLHISDENEIDHFENLNSTNWQSVRFKPPPPGSSNIGWRVEMRPMETQLTDFENAAYVTFVVLMTRIILSYDLTLIVPMSKVQENMRRAVKRDAATEQKFFFRKNLEKGAENDAFEEMTLNEIINGKEGGFPGLMTIVEFYLNHLELDADTKCTISQYLELIRNRASGQLMTTAKYFRTFIRSHPEYKFDSVVSESILYDLLVHCNKISNGEVSCPELFADPNSKTCHFVSESCRKMQEEVERITKWLQHSSKATMPHMVSVI